MQGQRSTAQSLSEPFEFDHDSSSSNSGADQPHYLNSMLNPVNPGHLQGYVVQPGITGSAHTSSLRHDGGSLSGWNLGGPSSIDHNPQHQMIENEAKTEHMWIDQSSKPEPVLVQEEVRWEETCLEGAINLNSVDQPIDAPWFQGLTASEIPQSSNAISGFGVNDGESQSSHYYKASGSGAELIPSAMGVTDPYTNASSSTLDYLSADTDFRPDEPLDSRRFHCKRKAHEGVSGQASVSGDLNIIQQAESNVWHAASSQHNRNSCINVSSGSVEHMSCANTSEEPSSQRVSIGLRRVPASDSSPSISAPESSQRNFRLRINSRDQDSAAHSNLWSGGSVSGTRRSQNGVPRQLSARLLPFSNTADTRASTTAAIAANTSQALCLPSFLRSAHRYPAHMSISSRPSSSISPPVMSRERPPAFLEGTNSSSNLPRSISEYSLFGPVADMRHGAQDPNGWSGATNGNTSEPGNVASSSRVGLSSSGIHTAPSTSWAPQHPPPTLYSRRISELVRRSLFPSSRSEAGAHSSSYSSGGSVGHSSSQESVFPSGSTHHEGHQYTNARSLWMDRQGDGALGMPLSIRSLAHAPEGRSRLASEIRSVLDLVRRGESLRFEDGVVVLDHSVFYGIADLHDRHRDMRLDVDNMSYEELLALEERIGNVSTGLTEETVIKCLRRRNYMLLLVADAAEVEPCCICQEEYREGEEMGTLDCGHDFHSACIKQWLVIKNLCPICKTTALVT